MYNFGFNNSQDPTRTEDQYPRYHEYNFDPYYFGFPHRVASPQVTDSFWQQIPISSGNDYIHYSTVYGVYFNHTDSPLQIDAMDNTTVKIGFKTSNSSKPKAQHAQKRTTPKPQLVEIYVRDELVKTIPLRQLIRFSKAAARAFPKPEEKAASSEGGDEVKNSANEKANTPSKDIKNTKKATTPQNLASSKGKTAKPINAKNGKIEVASSPKPLPSQTFIVESANAWTLPTVKAVHQCLTWMDLNKTIHGGQPLGPFYLPEMSEGVSLASYVDVYAAVIALQLRPFPGNLRQRIMDHLTKNKPLHDDVYYIGERVPLEDGVITRVLTSIVQKAEKSEYLDHEWSDIFIYIKSFPELRERYTAIRDSRGRNHEKQDGLVDGSQRLHRGWQELDGGVYNYASQENHRGKKRGGKKEKSVGDGSSQGTPTSSEGTQGAVGESQGGGVPAKKEKLDGIGKGIAGKHVPGV
ncbi:hypothetical protein LTR97_000947 [Elasticomyces elasticus]|uniref:Uncharacterized protein n=1 Tax=Elasticomyces elasticus TaxID=574655 RepID=A0AAN7ZR59_9PEZI|nr:hypothetical protein LTR97_000947 [Elasticomyces elasticus]